MASIRNRNGKWQAQIRLATGPNLSRSFHFKADAMAWAREMESDIQAGRYKAPQALSNFRELLARYAKEITPKKKQIRTELGRIKNLCLQDFAALPLNDLKPMDIAKYRDKRLAVVGPQTVRHDLNLLGHVLKIAQREWGLELHSNPVEAIQKPAQPKGRTRRLKPSEMSQFMAVIGRHPNHLFKAFIALAVETGMRRGELLGLTWRDIDFERSVAFLERTKSGYARAVPLTPAALQIIKQVGTKEQNSTSCIFPLTARFLNYHWERSLRHSNMQDYHIHDLRREAVSRFFEMGLSVPEVASISGHRDLRMVARYTKFDVSALVDKIAALS